MDTSVYFCDKNMDNNQFAAYTCICLGALRLLCHMIFGDFVEKTPHFFKSYLENEFFSKK